MPGDLAAGRNFVFCLMIVAIFVGLGRACRLERIVKLLNGGQATKGETNFMGEIAPSGHHVKTSIWQL